MYLRETNGQVDWHNTLWWEKTIGESVWIGQHNPALIVVETSPNMGLLVCVYILLLFKGSLGGETSVLRTFRMSGK